MGLGENFEVLDMDLVEIGKVVVAEVDKTEVVGKDTSEVAVEKLEDQTYIGVEDNLS